ncbi:AsmA-like C-terminal region-containing protein [Hansschlegelia quercus]|uniref:AsmA family protein n=1 Tax=Hansschlegelia quercus TaxID=2528245 RepID=A0A4Q9GBR9_9HYPH|nr:AsmA-like C-terminal region-containing protein [Hansschlegelia quercus]TBN48731.1 AsmA family protein [Hansschlegelia quercus]
MNNTLTGLGLALVLALFAALIGPLFVDWSAYRDDFAREAGRLIGAPAKVAGDVEVRLLPTPYARFHGLSAGDGKRRLAVDEVEIELAFAALLKGEFKAERLLLRRPKLEIEINADGAVATPFTAKRAAGDADRISFDRAEIEGGAIVISAPSGRYQLHDISGVAEAASLNGPLRFDGAGSLSGARSALRLSTSRVEAGGSLRFKLEVAAEGRPETVTLDGALTSGPRPTFDGAVAIVRPAGRDPQGSDPWRATAALKGDARRLAIETLDIVYGPDDRAARLSGRGALLLGGAPSFDLALEGRQVDIDRLAESSEPTPGGRIATLGPRLAGLTRPPFGGRLAIDLGAIVIGGDLAQDVSAVLLARKDGWRIERLSAALPGGAKASLSGAVAFGGGGPGFAGPVDLDVADFAGLRRWIAGGARVAAGPARRISLKGDVTARIDAVTIDNADLTVDGAGSRGRLAWRSAEDTRGRPAIEAALASDRLDLDALGIDRAVFDGLKGGDFDLALTLDARSLVFGGVGMSGVALEGLVDSRALTLKRLNVADAEGASVSGAGRLALGDGAGDGELKLSAAAKSAAPLAALVRAVGASEAVAAGIETRGEALAPFRLAIELTTDSGGAKLAVKGDAAGGTLDLAASSAEISLNADAALQATLATPDGARLATLAGFSVSPLAAAPGGSLSISLRGSPAKGMAGKTRMTALGLDLGFQGDMAYAADAGARADGVVTLKGDDLVIFAEAIGRVTPGVLPPTPAALTAKLKTDGDETRLDAISGTISGRRVAGALSVPADARKGFSGDLSFDRGSLSELAALAFGPDALGQSADRRSLWPSAAFGPSPLRGLTGRVNMALGEADLTANRIARDVRFALVAKPNGLALENLSADVEGGRLTGVASVGRQNADASVTLDVALKGARAEQVVGAPSPLKGEIEIALQAQATGRSIAGLIASLNGAGSATIAKGAIAGFDPAAIARIEPQVEAGLALDASRIAEAVERGLGSGDLPLARATLPFTIAAGSLRSGALKAESSVARLDGGATLDLPRLWLDADLMLAAPSRDAPQVGVSFEGPLSGPRRRVDATGLVNWLSVRAVERETKRIEAMEAEMRDRARIAREKADAARAAKAEEARKRAEAEKRADAERRKQEAETKALLDALPQPASKPDQPQSVPPAVRGDAPQTRPEPALPLPMVISPLSR